MYNKVCISYINLISTGQLPLQVLDSSVSNPPWDISRHITASISGEFAFLLVETSYSYTCVMLELFVCELLQKDKSLYLVQWYLLLEIESSSGQLFFSIPRSRRTFPSSYHIMLFQMVSGFPFYTASVKFSNLNPCFIGFKSRSKRKIEYRM